MSHPQAQLLIIDPQNDFCDLPADWCPHSPDTHQLIAPSLAVAGAHADMQRLSSWMAAQGDKLGQITITLDSHQAYDIAHPAFWQQRDGHAVLPFTSITAAQVRAGDYAPRNAAERERTLQYLDQLEAQGSYTLMVWPTHCEIGSWGHNIHHDLHAALNRWEEARATFVTKVTKGENPMTEHYSALQAEVPVADDPATQLNQRLLARLRESERIYIAGEAGSHCVKATVEHLVAHWPTDELGRLTLIEDCISAVGGFEAAYADFLAEMCSRGVQVATADRVSHELLANAKRLNREQ